MGSYIARQPNGLICRHSTVVDCVTHWNMTEEDYVEMCIERAKKDALFDIEYNIHPIRNDVSSDECIANKLSFAAVTAHEVLSDYMQAYQNVIDDFRPQNMTKKKFKELRKIMEGKV